MKTTTNKQVIIALFEQEEHILSMVESFLVDRKARGSSRGTLEFYRKKLRLFTDYSECQVIIRVTQITPHAIRLCLLYLEEKGHNHGGVHAAYRSLRAFLYWWEDEVEPEGWKNPIRKVKAPRVPNKTLEPVELDVVSKMIERCESNTFYGERDKAIFLCLLDSGTRANEFLKIDIMDINLFTGNVLIRHGKGEKQRTVFLGRKSRRTVRKYLKLRLDDSDALWVTRSGDRLTYWGLRQVLVRRASNAGITRPSIHSFRRAFALNMLRAGVDVYSLQALMGHSDLQVLKRYLKQTDVDLQNAHALGSPVDRWGL